MQTKLFAQSVNGRRTFFDQTAARIPFYVSFSETNPDIDSGWEILQVGNFQYCSSWKWHLQN